MKVIIIGNGKVGFALAQQLSGDGEDHELVLIDKNPDALRDADGTLIGYYEKHEYRSPETMKLYDME